MNFHLLLPMLLGANAILHIIQSFMFGFNSTTTPVVIWGIALAVMAYAWRKAVPTWLKWLTLFMPLFGGIGLASGQIPSTNPLWLDYSIIGLDIVTVLVMIYYLFLNKNA